MTDVDLSWMNVPGPDGQTWAQKYAAPVSVDLSWMNVRGPDGLTFVEKHQRGLLPGQTPILTPEQQKSWYELNQTLKAFGLDGMSERVKKYIIENGTDDPTRIRLWLMEQPEFKTRFPAMEKLSKAGRAISPEEYIQAEQQYIGVMRQAGLNPEFFDEDPGKSGVQFHKLIENEVLPEEFRMRVQDGFNRVANADSSIRNAFKNYFGLEGDQALAAFFIDSERAAPALVKAASAAEMGAAASKNNLNIDLNYATRLAEQGVSYQQAQEGMRRVSQLSALFTGGIGETAVVSGGVPQSELPEAVDPDRGSREINIAGNKFNANQNSNQLGSAGSTEDQLGVDYVFGTNVQTQKELEMRLAKRKAQSSGTSQQVVSDRQGRTAIGTAE
jgi:hypothetical protein